MDVVTLAAANAAASRRLAGGTFRCSKPAGLGWDDTALSFTIDVPYLHGLPGAVSVTPEAAFDLYSTARSAPTTTYYVAASGGSDGNNGLTLGTALATPARAQQLATATGQPALIYVAARTTPYGRQEVPSFLVNQSTDIAWVATGGRVVFVGGIDAFTAAADATFTNTYSYAVTNVNRVLDMLRINIYGGYVELRNVATAALCNRLPDSWALVSGTLYINRGDGAQPTTTNTRVLRAATTIMQAVVPCSLYMGGQTAGDGFDMEGGSVAVVNHAMSSATTTRKALVLSQCTARYPGGISNLLSPCVRVESFPGLVYLDRCHAGAGQSDGFNIHNTSGSGKTYFLTVNSSGSDHGRTSNNSCNGWTTHEDVVGIDVAGYYWNCHGGSVASVNASKSLLAGTWVRDDLGDLTLSGGGVLPPTAFYTNDTAEYWCDHVRADMPAGTRSFWTRVAGAKIHLRNALGSRGIGGGLGTVDTY